MLAVPLAYGGVTFVTAFVKTVQKFSSPKAQRKKLVNQNAMLCRSIDELLRKDGTVHSAELKALEQKTEFNITRLLHCRVLDLLGADNLRIHPKDKLCTIRDRVSKP